MKTKLFEHDVKFWLEEQYPLTVVHDRYGGTYSGGKFLAFPREFDEIESEVCGSDPECMLYWHEFEDFVGKGATIDEAISDLRNKLQEEFDGGCRHCQSISDIQKLMNQIFPKKS